MTLPDPDELLAQAPWVRRLARSLLRDAHRAEDVSQEALALGIEKRRSARPWLARVVRNLARRSRTGEAARARREHRAARREGGDPEGEVARRIALHERLVAAVRALDEPYRTAVWLRYFDGLAPREIARTTGCSPEAARQRVSRGLARLRQRLEGELGEGRSLQGALIGLLEGGRLPFAWPMTKVAAVVSKKVAVGGLVVSAAVVGIVLGTAQLPGRGGIAPDRASGERGVELEAPVRQADADGARQPGPDRATTSVGPSLAVHVRDELGRPVPDAWVLSMAGDELLGAEAVDEQGTAFADPRAKALVVAAPDHALQEVETEGRAELVVTLPDGERVAGRLWVDGDAPVRPLVLILRHDRRLELPRVVAVRLHELGFYPPRELPVSADGTFTVSGLAPGWSGSLGLPDWLRLVADAEPEPAHAPDERKVLLPRAIEQVVLRTTLLPTLRGRVVWEDTKEALGGVSYTFRLDHENGSSTGFRHLRRDGRFEHLLMDSHSEDWRSPSERLEWTGVRLEVLAQGECAGRAFEWTPEELSADGRVGDLEVPRRAGRPLHFRVLDGEGEGVAGAVLYTAGQGVPVGEDGRGSLDFLPASITEVHVGAPGLAGRRFDVAGETSSEEQPLRFVLDAPCNRLVLVLRDARGEAVHDDLQLVLRSPAPLFTSLPELGHELGATRCSGGGQIASGYQHFVRSDREGRVVLRDLTPGLVLEVEVVDAFNAVLLERRIETPGSGAALEVALDLPRRVFSITGRVVDMEGEDVSGATVQLSSSVSTRTDAEGRFTLQDVLTATDSVDLEVKHPLYAGLRVPDLSSRQDHDLGTVVLPPRRELIVVLEDSSGAVIDDTGVSASGPRTARSSGTKLAPGRWRFLTLPPWPVELHAAHGLHDYRIEEPGEPGEFRWTLPAHGGLRVVLGPTLAPTSEQWAHVRIRWREDPEVTCRLAAAHEPSGEPLSLAPGTWDVEQIRLTRTDTGFDEHPTGRRWQVVIGAGKTTELVLD